MLNIYRKMHTPFNSVIYMPMDDLMFYAH